MKTLIGCLVLVAGCSGSGTDKARDPDASVVGTVDGPPGFPSDAQAATGLAVVWETDPVLPPILIEGGGTLLTAMLKVARCEVIGDSTSGDDRTTATNFVLGWSTTAAASSTFFWSAPPGRYSKLSVTLNATGSDWVYEMTGNVNVMGVEQSFVVRDTKRVDIDETFDLTLAPGGVDTIRVKVDLADALKNVDWENVPVQNNVRELVSGPELDEVRNRLKNAFDIQ
ncbi:MAG: hypothetical protein AB7P03_19580 [Kofleriaceae bacterium]